MLNFKIRILKDLAEPFTTAAHFETFHFRRYRLRLLLILIVKFFDPFTIYAYCESSTLEDLVEPFTMVTHFETSTLEDTVGPFMFGAEFDSEVFEPFTTGAYFETSILDGLVHPFTTGTQF